MQPGRSWALIWLLGNGSNFQLKKLKPLVNKEISAYKKARDGIRTLEGLKTYDKTGGLRDALPYSTPYSTPYFPIRR